MGKPFIIICIVNWNRYEDTAECLNSLASLDYPNYEIVVVDNGSNDESADRLRKEFPHVFCIENGKNLGFAGGTNVGIRYALKRRADYVFLLNNDAIVDSQMLDRLVTVAESDKSIGMVGPAIYCYVEKNRFWSAGMELIFSKGKIFPQYLMRGKGEADIGQYGKIEDIDMINACALLVKRELIEDIGLLDEDFFLYNEDSDWNERASAAGYRIVYVPEGRVWHKGSKSSGGECSALSWFYTVRNQLFFYKKRTRWWNIPKLYYNYLRENYWLWKGFMNKGDKEKAKAVLDGIWCGIANRKGERKSVAPRFFYNVFCRKLAKEIPQIEIAKMK